MELGSGFAPITQNRHFRQGNDQLKALEGETDARMRQRESVDLSGSDWQFPDQKELPKRGCQSQFRFPNEVQTPEKREGDLHWVLGGDLPENRDAEGGQRFERTENDSLGLWEHGQAGALLGGDSLKRTFSYEEHGGAILRT